MHTYVWKINECFMIFYPHLRVFSSQMEIVSLQIKSEGEKLEAKSEGKTNIKTIRQMYMDNWQKKRKTSKLHN